MLWVRRMSPGEDPPPGKRRAEDYPHIVVPVLVGIPVLLGLLIGAIVGDRLTLVELIFFLLPALVAGALLWVLLKRMSRQRRSGPAG